jgi:hypothetical protein
MAPSTSDPSASRYVAPGSHYAYKPSLFGAAYEFRLGADDLEWQLGRRAGRIPYRDITRMRLSFRPATMQSHRFLMEIWSTKAPKLAIASTSWRTMLDLQRHDAEYAAFVQELHRRLVRAGVNPALDAGAIALLYWPGVAVFAATAIVLVVLAVYALQTANWAAAGIVAFFLAMFLWQAGNFFYRNRPQTYRATVVPPRVLPRS